MKAPAMRLALALVGTPALCEGTQAQLTVTQSYPQLAQDTLRILFRVQQFEDPELANAGVVQQFYDAQGQVMPVRYGARPMGGGNADAPLSGGRCVEMNPGEALRIIVPTAGSLHVPYGVGVFLFDFHHTDRGGSTLSFRLADAGGSMLGEWPIPLVAATSGEEQNARAVCFAVVADQPIGWAELRNGLYKTGVDDMLAVCDFSRPYKPLAPPIARAYAIEQLPLKDVVGLNNLGQVVGKAREGGQWQLWHGGATRDLVPSGNDTVSWVYDFNDAGQIVCSLGTWMSHKAAVLEGSAVRVIGADTQEQKNWWLGQINDRGDVLGSFYPYELEYDWGAGEYRWEQKGRQFFILAGGLFYPFGSQGEGFVVVRELNNTGSLGGMTDVSWMEHGLNYTYGYGWYCPFRPDKIAGVTSWSELGCCTAMPYQKLGQEIYWSHGVVVNDINDAGLFVGCEEIQSSGPNYEMLLDGPHAFIASVRSPNERHRFGKWAFGDPASGVTSVARSINESGQVVGWRTDPQLPSGHDLRNRAFLWHDGQTYELNDWVPPGSGVHLESGDVINDLGQILTSGPSYPTPRYLLTPLPAIAGIRPAAGGGTELVWEDWGDRWRYEVEIAGDAAGPWRDPAAPGGQPIAGGSWVDPEPAATVGARYYRVRAGHDWDLDGVLADNCPGVANPDQADADADGFGDACDPYPTTPGR